MRVFAQNLCLLFAMLVSSNSCASQIKVSPVRVDFTSQQPISVITVSNPDDSAITIQTHLVKWTQTPGDQYEPSRDILVVPPMFTIAPHEKQVVRLACQHAFNPNAEYAYRLFLKEIPPLKSNDQQGLNMSLTVRLPVFVLPNQQLSKPHWLVKDLGQEYEIQLKNAGNITLMISEVQLKNLKQVPLIQKQSVFNYIFPQRTQVWRFPKQNVEKTKAVQIIAQVNGREITHEAKSI